MKKILMELLLLVAFALFATAAAFAITIGCVMLIYMAKNYVNSDFVNKDSQTLLIIIFIISTCLIFFMNAGKVLKKANKFML